MSEQPYLLITMGPTGSGKSTLKKEVKELYNIEFTDSILIDDLVVENKYYKEAIDKYFEKLKEKNKDIVQMFEIGDETLIKKLNEIYFFTRENVYCNSLYTQYGKPLDNENIEYNKTKFKDKFPELTDEKLNCDNFNDAKLKDAIKGNRNIVLETTGITFPDWLFEHSELKSELQKYKIVCALSVVDICQLLNRNITRATKSLKKYLNNEYLKDSKSSKVKPPRLPEINRDIYTNNLVKLIHTFRKMVKKLRMNKCFTDSIQHCNLLVYDNNGKEMKLLFNNDKHRLTKRVVESLGSLKQDIVSEVEQKYDKDKQCTESKSKSSLKKQKAKSI